MAQPTASDLAVSIPLTNVANAYLQEEDNFIAGIVFPILSVQEKSANYKLFDRSDWFRPDVRERAPGTPSVGGGFDVAEAPLYNARVYAIHKDVDDQTSAAAQS